MKKSVNVQTLRFYWAQVRNYKFNFWYVFLSIPSSSLLLDTLMPLFLSLAVATFTGGNNTQLPMLLIYASLSAFLGVVFYITGFIVLIKLQQNVRADLAVDTLDKLLKKDASFFANQKIGALTGRYIDFINTYINLEDLLIIRTLTFAINIVIGTVIIFINAPILGWVVIGLIISLIFLIKISIKFRTPLRNARKELIGHVNGTAADTITNNLTVNTYANNDYELTLNKNLNNKYTKVFIKDFNLLSVELSGRLFITSAIQIVTIAIIASLLINNQISLGIAIFVVAYLQRIASQLFNLGDIINGYDRLFLQAAPITEMLLEPPKITDKPNASKLHDVKGRIDFVNVSYAYSDDADTNVLSNINLTIKAGQRVGLVGVSGAGKTTITKLLLRFDDVTSGGIKIDGQNIADVSQTSLRQAISFVPQEPMLFHRSLRDNIIYGKLDASDSELSQAIEASYASEFINRLPNGVDTVVGERGVKLSGGQRQRIAIARAILKDAPILILDEATSALDSESEKLIQKSLDSLIAGRTSIVIAHRLSTIAKLDRIIVLNNGKITEDGTHKDLIKQNGIYAKLWQHQSGGFMES